MAIGMALSLGADIFNRLSNLRNQRQNAKEWNAQQAQNRRINEYNAGRQNALEQNFDWGAPDKQSPYDDYL